MRTFKKKHIYMVSLAFVLMGLASFILGISGGHPAKAWQAYLTNVLLWSAMAQGGLLFSMVCHLTHAKWGKTLEGVAESFAFFFPISFVLFIILFAGADHIFPWLKQDLYGKEQWLNLPFLFSRDMTGIAILYGLGLAYLYYSLRLKLKGKEPSIRRSRFLYGLRLNEELDLNKENKKLSVLSVLYAIGYAVVLSILAFDLVMSLDIHWYSTLFGAYSFVKAFYVGLGGIIILSAILQRRYQFLSPSHFHDLGKLFLGFCLMWADFFYCQFVVIWYGNIPEETTYIIKRTMTAPWGALAWTVFASAFVIPFFILLNRKIKTKPLFMLILSALVIVGIWLEHQLLVGPALFPHAISFPLTVSDALIFIGFMGMMAMAVTFFVSLFPELWQIEHSEVK